MRNRDCATALPDSAGTLKRVLLTPASSMEFVLSKVVIILMIALLQAALLFLVAGAAFSVQINWEIVPYSFAIVALISVTFSSLGMIIASVSDSENTALLGSLVLCLPMLFLSGVFFPIELMIAPVQWISMASPLTHSVVLLEQFLVYQVDALYAGTYLSGLMIWTIASLLLSAHFISRLRK